MSEGGFSVLIELPVRTVSEANCREHWSVKRRRHRMQQAIIRQAMAARRTEWPLPCDIVLTRLSTHRLDSDNLQCAFKWLRDEIAEIILPDLARSYRDKRGRLRKLKGRADDDPRISWHYAQEKGKPGIKIEITSRCTSYAEELQSPP